MRYATADPRAHPASPEPASRALSLAAGCVPDLTHEQIPRLAARAGFDACGLRLSPDVTAAGADRIRATAADLGITVLDVEVARLGPGRNQSDLARLVELAVRLRARFLLTVSDHTDDAATVDDLARLAALAHDASPHLQVALEFMGFTGVRTLGHARSLLDQVRAVNTALVVDVLHLHRSGGRPADLTVGPYRTGPARVGYLQLCDAAAEDPGTAGALAHEARHHRRPPGEGELTLVDVVRRVPDVPISVEVQSDELIRELAPEQRAHLLLERTRAVLARAGRVDLAHQQPAAWDRGTREEP